MAPVKIAAYGLKNSGETEVDEATDIHGNKETGSDDPPPIEDFAVFGLHISHKRASLNSAIHQCKLTGQNARRLFEAPASFPDRADWRTPSNSLPVFQTLFHPAGGKARG